MRIFRHGWILPASCAWRWCFASALMASTLVGSGRPAEAQRVVRAPEQIVSVSKGASALLVNPTPIQRFSIGDPAVAEAVVVSPTEVLINGKTLGTTSLFLWDNSGAIKLYSVEVTADAPGLQRYLSSVLAGETIDVIASGNVVTLSGQVRDASVANRAVEIAKGSGATIVDNLTTPEAVQVLLKVRFAEVNKSAIKEFRSQLATLNPHKLDDRGRLGRVVKYQSGDRHILRRDRGPRPLQRECQHRAAHPRPYLEGSAEEPGGAEPAGAPRTGGDVPGGRRVSLPDGAGWRRQ